MHYVANIDQDKKYVDLLANIEDCMYQLMKHVIKGINSLVGVVEEEWLIIILTIIMSFITLLYQGVEPMYNREIIC